MDEKSFYGGVLHVCYVPEYETVEDTRLKLQDRRRYILRAVHNKGTVKINYRALHLIFVLHSFEALIFLCFV